MMESVDDASSMQTSNNRIAECGSAEANNSDSDSIGSGPAATDSNGSLHDSSAVVTHNHSDICTTVSIATSDATVETSDATVVSSDGANSSTDGTSATRNVSVPTSVFVDSSARDEITQPVGWSVESVSAPAILATQDMTADVSAVSSELGPMRHVTLTSPLPSLISSLRDSAITAVKRTRQSLSERLGHGTKTVDMELESRIEGLRSAQQRYISVLTLARTFVTHFSLVVSSQQELGTTFADMAQKMPELRDEFMYNAETQRVVYKNGESLLYAVNFFISTLNTLCYKTIEDTLLTVRQYDEARMEFDAYRADIEARQPSAEIQKRFEQHKQKFEELRQVVDVKLKFVHENKVKVMHQQLILFHNAIAAYFSGNQTALEDTLQQFSIKQKAPNSPS